MCELWVEWMMNSGTETTSVGNYKAPFVKTAKELVVLVDLGPVVGGCVERNFQNEISSGREADTYITELERDFSKDEE